MCLCLVCAACGSGAGAAKPTHPDERGYADRMLDAQEHDRRAAEHDRAAAGVEASHSTLSYACGDPVLNDQLTSGGTKVTTWQPCFDVTEEGAIDQRYAAEHERDLAARERHSATALVRAEVAACQGVPERERDHSAFAHRSEIADVIPHREAGQVRGVWVVFKPVVGMTADWLRRDIACQHARWAVLGKPPAMAATDPTLVAGAQAQVFDRHDHLEVLVLTDSTDAGQMALARARLDQPQRTQTAVR
jgi:hypothetical protein